MDLSNLQLTFPHVDAEKIGYGRMGINLVASLRNMGVTVYDRFPTPTDQPNIRVEMEQGKSTGMTKVVCWASVPTHAAGWWSNQIPTILTMWEATRLPEAFRETMHEFDTVIVPSEQNLELFSQYHPNVKKINLGFNPVDWAYYERQQPEDYFYFLCGGSGARKGVDLALAAFYNCFSDRNSWGDGPIPMLYLKNPRNEDPEAVLHRVLPEADYSFIADRVQVFAGHLPPEDEVALYASSHCYLQPSRGEGWGLQPLQAIAQGMPTILTNAHGHAAFAHLGWPLSTTLTKAENFMMGDAGEWWEPNLDELEEHMFEIYFNYDHAAALAKTYSTLAHKYYTWQHSAIQLVQAIGANRLTSLDTPGTWHEPAMKLYPVITTRDYSANIASGRLRFEAGKTYWQSADVKRILFEGGILDPSCIEAPGAEDSGLLPSQVERSRLNKAEHEFCPECMRRFSDGKTVREVMRGK